MAVDIFAPQSLLKMKRDNDFAPRVKAWPPEGYVAPTAEEFAELREAAHGYSTGLTYRSVWKRVTDDQVLRRYQLAELARPMHGRAEANLYAYTRALRDELRRRGLVHRSLAVLRCEACSHGTERLFEVTQETHPGLKSQRGPMTSGWYCARCWSGRTWDGDDEEAEAMG